MVGFLQFMQSNDRKILENLVQNLFKAQESPDSGSENEELKLNEDSLLILQAWLGSNFLSSSLALLESNKLVIIEHNGLKLLLCFKHIDNIEHIDQDHILTLILNNVDALSTEQRNARDALDLVTHICTCGATFRPDFKPAVGCIHTLAWYIYNHHSKILLRFVPTVKVNDSTKWINIQDAIYKNSA